jgi:hypothetical protein
LPLQHLVTMQESVVRQNWFWMILQSRKTII